MLWMKAFHVMMMTSWFAGLFYLPRLFVYHAMSDKAEVHAQLSIMEGKLYRFVTPIMYLTILSGLILTYWQWDYLQDELWYALKVAVVVFLVSYHFYCGHLIKVFAAGDNARNHVFYRFFNEAPVLGLIAILIFVLVRPFS
ncbi:MAG: hypothetical protein AUK35_08835 [Zetaproteobacteria bacterium CG2_30_46_52]|nr:MAG: hypothetical protein AUK35_08835 [Zetaproteobacteria bacterium CG2_30_46_52]